MRLTFPQIRYLAPWMLIGILAFLSTLKGSDVARQITSALRRTAFVHGVENAERSVVNIHGRKTVRSDQTVYAGDSFRQVNGMGTGIVIDERGYIMTNYHVVQGVNRIQVTLADKRTVVGKLVNHDLSTDLAIIKIPVDEPMPVISIGTSADLMRAEPVVAVGNAYGYEHTVTQGIISALHRAVQVSEHQHYHDLIQTDASINPGNSGGPLLNAEGEMIGINVAVRVGAQGIGFAIPVDEAMDIASELMASEEISNVAHGVRGQTMTSPQETRFIVQSVGAGSSAAESGLRPKDTVISLDGRRVERSLDFERALIGHREGDIVEAVIQRDGERKSVRFELVAASAHRRTVEDRAWSVLGLRLSVIPESVFQRINGRYRGGLRVVSVRPGSPSAEEGIVRGDILIGMHKWETVSLDNIAYVLDSNELADNERVKFYILRGNEPLYGHLRVAARK